MTHIRHNDPTTVDLPSVLFTALRRDATTCLYLSAVLQRYGEHDEVQDGEDTQTRDHGHGEQCDGVLDVEHFGEDTRRFRRPAVPAEDRR